MPPVTENEAFFPCSKGSTLSESTALSGVWQVWSQTPELQLNIYIFLKTKYFISINYSVSPLIKQINTNYQSCLVIIIIGNEEFNTPQFVEVGVAMSHLTKKYDISPGSSTVGAVTGVGFKVITLLTICV